MGETIADFSGWEDFFGGGAFDNPADYNFLDLPDFGGGGDSGESLGISNPDINNPDTKGFYDGPMGAGDNGSLDGTKPGALEPAKVAGTEPGAKSYDDVVKRPPQSSLWSQAAKAIGGAAAGYARSATASQGTNSGISSILASAAPKQTVPYNTMLTAQKSATSSPAATAGPDALSEWTRIFSMGR